MYVTHDATYEAGENDEILIIAIAFNTNEPNYMNNLNVTIHRHNTKYANDEISTRATAFITSEPKLIGIMCLTIHTTQYLYEAWSTEDL